MFVKVGHAFYSIKQTGNAFTRVFVIRQRLEHRSVGKYSFPKEGKLYHIAGGPAFAISPCFYLRINIDRNSIGIGITDTVRYGAINGITDDGSRETMMQHDLLIIA